MRKTLRLAKREYLAAVRTKGFLIGLILAPILMGGGFLGLLLFEKNVDISDKRIAVIDHSGKIANSIVGAAEWRNKNEIFDKESGKKNKPAYVIEVVEPNKENAQKQKLELSERVRQNKLHAFVEIGSEVVHPMKNREASQVAFYSKNSPMDDIRQWINWPINNQLRQIRLADAGINESQVPDLFNWANIEPLGLVSVDTGTGGIKEAQKINEIQAFVTPIIMMILLFMMLMMGAVPLLNSVMEEKNQHIAEVLLGSIKPFEFMMGKVIGGVGVSITASLVYIIGGIISVKRMGFEQYIPYDVIPWFFTYMVVSIVMFGSLCASVGSMCSEPKDAQSLSMPVMIPMLIPMFIMMPVIKEAQSTLVTALSLFPTFTPTMMLLRLGTPGGVPTWQPWAGLIGMLLFTVLFVWAGGRVFRVAILAQGVSPKLSNLVRWAIRG
jgi:ABC-2 type transport system permease protein